MYISAATVKTSLAVPQSEWLYDPANPVLGIYPREWKAYGHTKVCMQVFILELVKTAKKWKQSKCPSIEEQVNKMRYICTAIKNNDVLIHTTTWMTLENIMLSEKSQAQKITCDMIPFILKVQKKEDYRGRK